jgi:hypothetical protein
MQCDMISVYKVGRIIGSKVMNGHGVSDLRRDESHYCDITIVHVRA